METIRKTLKTATWKGVVVVVVVFFFWGGGAARSHPSGLRYKPRWVLNEKILKPSRAVLLYDFETQEFSLTL